MEEIKIKSCWSNESCSDIKKDFIYLANTVFGNFITEEYYRMKYVNNIYGESLLTVAYVNGEPAGTDVMWRNDVMGMKAFQTVDTCVLKEYRGIGIFKKITYHELDCLGRDVLIYGFPNANSYPGYLKMGWGEERLYNTLNIFSTIDSQRIDKIDDNYAEWWIKKQNGISYFCKQNDYYLIRRKKTKPIATVIGKVNEEIAMQFPQATNFLFLRQYRKQCSIYNKNNYIPIIFNKKKQEIPYWKIDAI